MSDLHSDKKEIYHDGIGRLGYFVAWVAVAIANILIIGLVDRERISALVFFRIILSGVIIALTALRLTNIGKSRWWLLLIWVPIANLLWVFLPCFVCQEGYEEARDLDRTGRVLNAVLWCVIAFMILIALGALVVHYMDSRSVLSPGLF